MHDGHVTALVHPATYLNKVLVGYDDGVIELWNFRRSSLIFKFTCHEKYFEEQRRLQNIDVYGNSIDDLDQPVVIPAVTCIEQSPACDVVAVGFATGDILLVNLKYDEILFSFQQRGPSSSTPSDNSQVSSSRSVTSISFRTDSAAEKFPYMVSGSDDGCLYVWHLGTGEENMDDKGDDDQEQQAEQEPRKLMFTIDEAHQSRISKVHFMHGEPILITSSHDNSIKMFIFDSPDGTARLLRFREGHYNGGPNRIRFYGGSSNVSMTENHDGYSCQILSAGQDQAFRLFNYAVESQNREISQKPMLKRLGYNKRQQKLPLMINFAHCETRSNDWDDIVSIHQNHCNAYLWRLKNRVVDDKIILRQKDWNTNEMSSKYNLDPTKYCSAVTISLCGHYCVVGHNGGQIYLYNVQSGIPRGGFPGNIAKSLLSSSKARSLLKTPGNVLHEKDKILGISDVENWKAGSLNNQEDSSSKDTQSTNDNGDDAATGHTDQITGLFLDSTLSVLVSSGLDGKLIFWNFSDRQVIEIVQINIPILKMECFRDGNFIAVVCGGPRQQQDIDANQDFAKQQEVRVYDLHSHRLCRRFNGHDREITDIIFSYDGRKILTSSLDSTIRVWDMSTARCLSWLKFYDVVVSMCLSLSGEFLCLSFQDKDGIYMYLDRSLYETVHFWREPTEPCIVDESHFEKDLVDENAQNDEHDVEQDLESTEQRGKGSITISNIPKAYWTSLLNLEEIKKRNKPQEPVSKPPQAPFFLPTVVRQGDTAPSFPTPQEYAKLSSNTELQDTTQSDGSQKNIKDAKESILGKRDAHDDDNQEFSGMTSAWSDNEDDEQNLHDDDEEDVEEKESLAINPDKRNKTSSRIIRRRTELPRCKLVAYIDMNHNFDCDSNQESPIVAYLKSIGPPAVDAEMRALCRDENDAEGVEILHKMLQWFIVELKTCDNFEVMQAYLYRFLLIYSEVILLCPHLHGQLNSLKEVHEAGCKKFRHLIQSNLCVLKMMAQIPSI